MKMLEDLFSSLSHDIAAKIIRFTASGLLFGVLCEVVVYVDKLWTTEALLYKIRRAIHEKYAELFEKVSQN